MVEALRRLMDTDRAVGMAVNLGNPEELTVMQLADMVVAMTGSARSAATPTRNMMSRTRGRS
jgi:nucleoside-diphosphate-sugar epimerase